jgi:hypothetical protein
MFIALAIFGLIVMIATSVNIGKLRTIEGKSRDDEILAAAKSAKIFNVILLVLAILVILGVGGLFAFGHREKIARLPSMVRGGQGAQAQV